MRNRLQLVNGYVNGTLNEEEKAFINQFPLLVKEGERLLQLKNQPKQVTPKGVDK